ncbi:MAG: hypothetical protein NUV61_02110 [Candidatus Azambacteria bacterium]|nr:hypothetical protein [Candidatus Azambacteria bacterium]
MMGKIIASSKREYEEEPEEEPDRFYLLEPEEREALRVLVTDQTKDKMSVSQKKRFAAERAASLKEHK